MSADTEPRSVDIRISHRSGTSPCKSAQSNKKSIRSKELEASMFLSSGSKRSGRKHEERKVRKLKYSSTARVMKTKREMDD